MNDSIDLINLENFDENEEQLKRIVADLRKYSDDLVKIKEDSDLEWIECSKYLDEITNNNINGIKDINNRKFKTDIEELENYANKLEYVTNVLKETEVEIKASTKKFESLFDNFEKPFFEFFKNNNSNK